MRIAEVTGLPPLPYRVAYPFGLPGDGFRRHAHPMKATAVVKYRGIPVAELARLPRGNELRYPVDALVADMRAHGWKYPPGTGGQDIIVYVDAEGRPKIGEGNHRLDAAIQAGLAAVPVEVRYLGRSDEKFLLWPFDPADPRIRVISD